VEISFERLDLALASGVLLDGTNPTLRPKIYPKSPPNSFVCRKNFSYSDITQFDQPHKTISISTTLRISSVLLTNQWADQCSVYFRTA